MIELSESVAERFDQAKIILMPKGDNRSPTTELLQAGGYEVPNFEEGLELPDVGEELDDDEMAALARRCLHGRR